MYGAMAPRMSPSLYFLLTLPSNLPFYPIHAACILSNKLNHTVHCIHLPLAAPFHCYTFSLSVPRICRSIYLNAATDKYPTQANVSLFTSSYRLFHKYIKHSLAHSYLKNALRKHIEWPEGADRPPGAPKAFQYCTDLTSNITNHTQYR